MVTDIGINEIAIRSDRLPARASSPRLLDARKSER